METHRYPDLASGRLGGRAVFANDEFFGPVERLVDPKPAVFEPGRYTDRGKWMDGWETRRRRDPGNDWAVVRLGIPGVVHSVVIDTSHFKGNHPESASVDGVMLESEPATWEGVEWTTLVPVSVIAPDSENAFAVEDARPWTHVRLSIFPDGGVARLRVHGEAARNWLRLAAEGPVDLASIMYGGRVIAASDEFFGVPHHLLLPGVSSGMHDGWETRRRRGPGNDWVAIRLGHRGRIARIEIDTHHFKGNHPESASLDIADVPEAADEVPEAAWSELLPRTKLGPDASHVFLPPGVGSVVATHVRLSIYPDGGVARLRVYANVLA